MMHGLASRGLIPGLAIALAVAGAGCGRREAPSQQPGPAAGAQTTVSLWTIWNAEPRKSALAGIIAAFQKEHPDIRVAVNTLEPDAYKTSIRVAVGSAEPPDVFFVWDGEWMHNFVRSKAVLDLTDRMDADGGKWRKVFLPEGLKRFTYRGRVWGVPYLLQCTFFLYSKAIFQKTGLVEPTTWQMLLDDVGRLREAGIVPLALGNQQRWPAHHFPGVLWQRLMGEDVVEASYDPLGPGKYAEAGWAKGLDLFSDLLLLKPFSEAPNAATRDSARALFYGGRTAMFYTGTWDFARLSQGGDAPREFWDAWDFFNFPALPTGKGDQTALAGAPDGYVVCSHSKHADAAVEFLKFLTRSDVAQGFVQKCQELVQVEGAVTGTNAGPRLRKYAAMAAAAKQICPWPDTLMERSVADELLNQLQAYLDSEGTPESILAKVRARQADVKQRLQQDEAAAGGRR
jgi:raffinose/stachyose/melibiose transport system substrate-binding protein